MSLTALAAANSLHSTEFLKLLWITNGIIATCYSYYWDVVMDWGLGNLSSKHLLLRDVITFSPSVYYTAIVLDFIFRLGIITIIIITIIVVTIVIIIALVVIITIVRLVICDITITALFKTAYHISISSNRDHEKVHMGNH